MRDKSKITLVLCQKYPSSEAPYAQAFIHTRLSQYPEEFNVKVLSFDAASNYTFDGIEVFTEEYFLQHIENFKVERIISHAPNIRNHVRLIIKCARNWTNNFIFFFHGYEVLNVTKRVYSQKTLFDFPEKPSFAYMAYQYIKIPFLRLFFKVMSTFKNTKYVFVGNSLKKEVLEDIGGRSLSSGIIINNSIGRNFYTRVHNYKPEQHLADYICIRPLNDPKYGADIYIEMAKNNPTMTFHLYGKGKLPEEIIYPANLKIIDKFFAPEDLIQLLNRYKAAILPTRWDSQGVLACEIASIGMPLITSDIEVCKEMLSGFSNVTLLSNELMPKFDLAQLHFDLSQNDKKKFLPPQTIEKEISLIKATF